MHRFSPFQVFGLSTRNSTQGKRKRRFDDVHERYCITIRPRLHRSSSLSDLTTNTTLDFFNRTTELLSQKLNTDSIQSISGDGPIHLKRHHDYKQYMSRNFKGKKQRRKPKMSPNTTYAAKFASKYVKNAHLTQDNEELNLFSEARNSSVPFNIDRISCQNVETFPFKFTPSGNLKVQSNQVVFQSSTVGVLLADPTQAKVKVKFEGKAAGRSDNFSENKISREREPRLQFDPRDDQNTSMRDMQNRKEKSHHPSMHEEKGKNLASMGYTASEPIDWTQIHLPEKRDLFQELFKWIHNHVNTDVTVHIGDEKFHCHRIVLQVYSSFFNMNTNHRNDIELPIDRVTPEAFRIIYDWMIYNGPDSNNILGRDNILGVFRAAQFLAIKDLEDQCWSFIVNESLFYEDTAFALFREARHKGMNPVMELMIPRVMKFFLPLVASRDFLVVELEEILTFLRSNYICVTSEIEVLMSAVRWLFADWASRKQFAVEVMRCVRFGLISPWQLVDIKRNPENAEVLEVVSDPEVQQMVDDGLAYVIIKYWYGTNSKEYYQWIDMLGLTEPAERNWVGEEKNHVTYKEFLKYLENFMAPKEQMYQQMAMMQSMRGKDDVPGSMRKLGNHNINMQSVDFPLPATLRGLVRDKEFPNMSDLFDTRRKKCNCPPPPTSRSSSLEAEPTTSSCISPQYENHLNRTEKQEPPEKHSIENLIAYEESSSSTEDISLPDKNQNLARQGEKRHSVAASYLAAATAALAGSRRNSHLPSSPVRPQSTVTSLQETTPRTGRLSRENTSNQQKNFMSPQISLFNHSKESLARINMNKLSASIVGPSNKDYIADGSLFSWDKETVLVFGGIDPHASYGLGKNTGKNIYRFDPVTNAWDNVGELPEPRHHHSVAFMRGRIYLVGGADPRDDDIRGKSVVVSTVWSFEPVTRSWYSESGLAIPRKNFGLVVHRMALYAIGGQDKKGRVLRSVERFDPKTGSWSEVRSLGSARMAAAAVKYRDYIWVAGGMTGDKRHPVSKVVECYNSKTNEWTEIHSLRFPRCFATLFPMNDKLYIVGGAGKVSDKEKTASSVSDIDVWDWHNRAWKQETEMSIPRHGHALAYLGTQLIIIGGVTTIYMRALNNVESFCCERGAWIRGVATLPSPLSGHGSVTLPPASLM